MADCKSVQPELLKEERTCVLCRQIHTLSHCRNCLSWLAHCWAVNVHVRFGWCSFLTQRALLGSSFHWRSEKNGVKVSLNWWDSVIHGLYVCLGFSSAECKQGFLHMLLKGLCCWSLLLFCEIRPYSSPGWVWNCVDQADLRLGVILLPLPECWDYLQVWATDTPLTIQFSGTMSWGRTFFCQISGVSM